jgi:hypothetical protein
MIIIVQGLESQLSVLHCTPDPHQWTGMDSASAMNSPAACRSTQLKLECREVAQRHTLLVLHEHKQPLQAENSSPHIAPRTRSMSVALSTMVSAGAGAAVEVPDPKKLNAGATVLVLDGIATTLPVFAAADRLLICLSCITQACTRHSPASSYAKAKFTDIEMWVYLCSWKKQQVEQGVTAHTETPQLCSDSREVKPRAGVYHPGAVAGLTCTSGSDYGSRSCSAAQQGLGPGRFCEAGEDAM